ncbi:hypothetical protein KBA41_12560 [Candidatus Ozemobacteraceae bacterium]|nr:hypothetical protein [Candidatus Ozemobacteraceae bacterium]
MSLIGTSRIFLVMNPSSRSFRSRYVWPAIFEGLKRRGADFDFALTEKHGDTSDLARRAVRNGFGTVVAVGGDGTINDVLNGLFEPGSEKTSVTFGVLYTGTSPDFCRNHGIPLDLEAAMDLLVSGRPRLIDVCRISHSLEQGGPEHVRLFSCCANFGLGAAVARGANTGLRKRFGDLGGTLISLVMSIVRFRPPTMRVRLDGVEYIYHNMYNLFVGKGRLVASGIKLDLPIEPNDGFMYVVPLAGISRRRLCSLVPRAYSGTLPRLFKPTFARQVDILEWGEAGEVEYDGDPRGFLPASIRVLQKSLPLIGPA